MLDDEAEGYRSLWSRMRGWFVLSQPEFPAFIPEPLPLRTMDEDFTILAPCKGDAFNFQVLLKATWSHRAEEDEFMTVISSHAQRMRNTMVMKLRNISRRYWPEEIRAFELEVVESCKEFKFPDNPGLTCKLFLCVEQDERLRKELREAKIEQVKADARREEAERWLAFLRRTDKDPLGSLSVQLAGNPDKVTELMAKHVSSNEQAIDQLRKACETYQKADLFDLNRSMDTAISRLLRYVDGSPESSSSSGNGSGPGS
ncbi:MAG: hypothetical protein J2P25_10970 [Nocardiopsaceae bacterium]|nr:hypothetical protein [Nocardiopsaceae bacterium]